MAAGCNRCFVVWDWNHCGIMEIRTIISSWKWLFYKELFFLFHGWIDKSLYKWLCDERDKKRKPWFWELVWSPREVYVVHLQYAIKEKEVTSIWLRGLDVPGLKWYDNQKQWMEAWKRLCEHWYILLFGRNCLTWVRQWELKVEVFPRSLLTCFLPVGTSLATYSQEKDLRRGKHYGF